MLSFHIFLSLALLAFRTTPLHVAASLTEEPKEVLVLGGNGFMGVYTVEALAAATSNQYHITVANSNTSYFDSQARLHHSTPPHAHAKVQHLNWNRRSTLIRNSPAMYQYFHTHPHIHAIVDFSCYDGAAAKDVTLFLLDTPDVQVDFYLYISSDSIYEVCGGPVEKEKEKEDAHTHSHRHTTEEGVDDHRPASSKEQARLNALDSYAHGKLEAEEMLGKIQPHATWSYFFLRIPDVVGPRDTSFRWWFYQILITLQVQQEKQDDTLQIPIPYVQADREGRPLSLIYVEDVAKAVVALLSLPKEKANLALNLADEQTWTFAEIMESIAKEVGRGRREIKEEEAVAAGPISGRSLMLALNETTDFPSVKRGPISTARAKKTLLGWEPTPWSEVVKETVQYFDQDAVQDPRFTKERAGVLQFLYQQASRYGKEKELRQGLLDIYGWEIREEEWVLLGKEKKTKGKREEKREEIWTWSWKAEEEEARGEGGKEESDEL